MDTQNPQITYNIGGRLSDNVAGERGKNFLRFLQYIGGGLLGLSSPPPPPKILGVTPPLES